MTRRFDWRNDYLVISAIVLAALLFVFLPGWMPVTAATEPVEACPEWRTAGGQMIYKCIDEDALVNCYQPAGGVMQCVPWQ